MGRNDHAFHDNFSERANPTPGNCGNELRVRFGAFA